MIDMHDPRWADLAVEIIQAEAELRNRVAALALVVPPDPPPAPPPCWGCADGRGCLCEGSATDAER